LQKFDERVKSWPKSASAYTDRGNVKYLIAEYSKAIKDYKDAIGLQRGLERRPDARLGIARSYARLKKYSDAEKNLQFASMTTLRELASDPAFGGMLETKYRRAFHLRE
jgi:tetratricopeptide (TPR) repeat protein